MIVLLKITVCFFKLVKLLPGVQNNSLMMNTPKSLDSLVVTTPGSQLLGVFGISIRTGLQKNFGEIYCRPGGKDSPVY